MTTLTKGGSLDFLLLSFAWCSKIRSSIVARTIWWFPAFSHIGVHLQFKYDRAKPCQGWSN
jgi:hypothetical protein